MIDNRDWDAKKKDYSITEDDSMYDMCYCMAQCGTECARNGASKEGIYTISDLSAVCTKYKYKEKEK